jgi:hypothetical protein
MRAQFPAICTITFALLLSFATYNIGFAQDPEDPQEPQSSEYGARCMGVCGENQIVPKCTPKKEHLVRVKPGFNFPQPIWNRFSNRILRVQRYPRDRNGNYSCACEGDQACYPGGSPNGPSRRPPGSCSWDSEPYYKENGDREFVGEWIYCYWGSWRRVQ